MRILLLSQFYAPVVGGIERVVEDVARALSQRGHEVAVATLASRDAVANEDGIRVYRLRSSAQRVPGLHRDGERPHALPAPDPEVALALRKVVAGERPHVVHAHDWLVHSYLPLRRRGGPPVLLSLHDHGLVCATRRLFRRGAPCTGPAAFKCLHCAGNEHGRFRGAALVSVNTAGSRALRKNVDMFLPVSETVARTSRLALSPRVPFEVIPNFVPSDLAWRATSAAPETELPRDFLLYVGDATPDKGIDVLLAAHSQLREPPPLVVLGRPYSPGLSSPSSDVRVLGPRCHDFVLHAIRTSTVTIVPSLVPETFGMVALEAMALGRPLVASRIGGLAELLQHEQTAVLVEPGDTEGLRRALAMLLEQPERRKRLAVAARADAERFAEAAVVPRLEAAYRAVAVNRTSSRAVEKPRTTPV
jgi:glycosyltransferase involved in cell wall biosynthesis